ncbi:hypothetical protein HYU15_00920 [Candidatus Woesearchaeota archaeon]|nr:hypothetical protein [Candidatus Woesearchaeota archaeon]
MAFTAFFSLQELIDLVIMIAAVGFIFRDLFARAALSALPGKGDAYDPIKAARKSVDFGGIFGSMKAAIIVTAPAIALHEMAHKFVSLGFGIPATFHASYFWLSIGVVLKLLSFPFIFFVPGYVEHTLSTPFVNAVIAFSGPAVNLALWLGSAALLKTKIKNKYRPLLHMTKGINMFLFIFNMIPIPPFDGSRVFSYLLGLLF